MPQAIAQAIEAPLVVALAQPPVLIEVRDIADLAMRQAAPATAGGRPADFERAEITREVPQLRVIEVLVVNRPHGVAVDRL